MSHKSARITRQIEAFQGGGHAAHYLGFFDCFNRQLFYEAHEVLEDLWLADRQGPDGDFYKGLIQLAGAFVHLQKNRLRPAAALFQLSQDNLAKYPRLHHGLDLAATARLIEFWRHELVSGQFARNPFSTHPAPHLSPARNSPLAP